MFVYLFMEVILMSDTKERILDTALRLFARSGFEAVSVSEIAAELSITKGEFCRKA